MSHPIPGHSYAEDARDLRASQHRKRNLASPLAKLKKLVRESRDIRKGALKKVIKKEEPF